MKSYVCRLAFQAVLFMVAIAAIINAPTTSAQVARDSKSMKISDSARQQISELLAEKNSRSAVQRKIGSSLLYMAKARRGVSLTPNVKMLRPLIAERPDGLVDVQIQGKTTKRLIEAVQRAGGKVVYGHVNGPLLRALVPIDAVEGLAARSEVKGIHQSIPAVTHQQLTKRRAEALRAPLGQAVARYQSEKSSVPQRMSAGIDDRGSVTSEGVAAHRADDALHFFGATGAGVKIGVLSDSDDFKEAAIASGDLPPDTVTVPGQDGRPGAGEGTAMMEIVHDMAPGAKLFFASAFNSPESFADNIRTLRFVYGCDIIVDDVIYFFESPYQDDIIAQAVNDVIADGGMYFSSAGNEGNFNDGTSGTWEGDFRKAKTGLSALPDGYEIHDFGGGVISDRIEATGGPLILHWSDPGSLDNPQAADDYDLFVLDSTLSNVIVASTDIQDGTGLPFEFLGFLIPPDFQVVVARKVGATDRAIRIEHFRGELAIGTSGATYGHNSAAGAFGTAAVDVATAAGGAFTGGPTNPVEFYSGDGNRRVFFDSAGNPYKPGKFLFKNNGGQLRRKPDIAAADGVSTTLPSGSGLNPFFGTSAAAPHAAAIAGLLKSVKPNLTPAAIRTALTKTALDIEAPGRDVDSGFGIVDAFGAALFARAKPVPFLDLGDVTATPTSGDGDAFLEPGESASLLTQLKNLGGAPTANLKGLLSTTTAGVSIISGNSTFPSIPALGGSAVNNVPYAFSLSSGLACGVAPEFTLKASYTNGPLSPQTFTFKVPTGEPSATPTTTSYSGAPVAIPDDDPAGTDIPITVSGMSALSSLVFSIDGSSCSTDIGSTTVGIDHTWVGDLIIKITSPSGTTVTLINQAGGALNSGNNFCQTVLDDSATDSIQDVLVSDAPFTGTFTPASPLAAFAGEDANGTWILNVSDNAFIDSGSVRAFSLIMRGFSCD